MKFKDYNGNAECIHTGCYRDAAYALFAYASAADGTFNSESKTGVIAKTDNGLIHIGTLNKQHSTSLDVLKPIRLIDNEVVLIHMGTPDRFDESQESYKSILAEIIQDLINWIGDKIRPTDKFWIYPKVYKSLKQYIGYAGRTFILYEHTDIKEVMESEFFTVELLKAVVSDLKNPSYAGKIDDPFVLNAKQLYLVELMNKAKELCKEVGEKLWVTLQPHYQAAFGLYPQMEGIGQIIPPDEEVVSAINFGNFNKIDKVLRNRVANDYFIQLVQSKRQCKENLELKAINEVLNGKTYKELIDLLKLVRDDSRLKFQPLVTLMNDLKFLVDEFS